MAVPQPGAELGLLWARAIEIARRPDLSTRYAHARGRLEDPDSAIAGHALRELTAVLDDPMKAVRG